MVLNTDNIILALSPLGEYTQRYNQLRYNCPWCEESGAPLNKFNLEIDVRTGRWNCWACVHSGWIKSLVEQKGVKELATSFSVSKSSTPGFQKPIVQQIHIPLFAPAYLNTKAYKYLLSRGVTLQKIKAFDIGYVLEGEYKGNIIFVSYDKNNIPNYFITHDFELKKYKKHSLNPDFCFYENKIDFTFPIILVEGVYDCLMYPNSIPLLGLSISNYLLEKLNNANVILVVDEQVNAYLFNTLVNKLKTVCSLQTIQIPTGLRDPNYALNHNHEFKKHCINVIKHTTENISRRRPAFLTL